MIVWGVCAVIINDNIVMPYLVGHRVQLPIVFLLFSILGGIEFFGMKGFILGPLFVALLPVVLELYRAAFLNQTVRPVPIPAKPPQPGNPT